MARRVIIQGGGSSPIRVSAAGVDANGAQFNDLIFDGNQSPMRLHGTGFVALPPINRDIDSVKTIDKLVTGASLPAVPSGTTPMFLVAVRNRSSDTEGRLQTPFAILGGISDNLFRGGGGAISDVDGAGLRFVALTFAIRLSTVFPNPQPSSYINYCIFRNTQ